MSEKEPDTIAPLISTKPARAYPDRLDAWIALDDPVAAKNLVRRVFDPVEQLLRPLKSGFVPPELRKLRRYRQIRQILEKPYRIFSRVIDDETTPLIRPSQKT